MKDWDELYDEIYDEEDKAVIQEGAAKLRVVVHAHRLAEVRKRRGMTQKSVAAAMRVSVARVSQIEHGDLTSVEVLSRYAEAIGGRLRMVVDFGDELVAV